MTVPRRWRSRRGALSAEEVGGGGTNEVAATAARAAPVVASDQDRGDAAVLLHQQSRGGGELVGDAEDGVLEIAAGEIAAAAEIEERADARDTERHLDLTLAPRAAERVGHDRANVDLRGGSERRA